MTSKLERTLAAIANASQIGLLALGVLVYVYTVIPVYQKSLLDEDIAKRTLELNSKTAEVAAKEKELAAMNAAVAEANAAVRQAQSEVSQTKSEVGKLKGNLQDQDNTIRPKLVADFRRYAQILCSLNKVQEDKLAACLVREIDSSGLDPLNQRDRAFLTTLVRQESPRLITASRELTRTYEATRQGIQEAREAYLTKCATDRAASEPTRLKDSHALSCMLSIYGKGEFTVEGVDRQHRQAKEDLLWKSLGTIVDSFNAKK